MVINTYLQDQKCYNGQYYDCTLWHSCSHTDTDISDETTHNTRIFLDDYYISDDPSYYDYLYWL